MVDVTMVESRPWACFARLAEVMPSNSVEAKRIQFASAIVSSVESVEKVALVLNTVAAPLMITPVGDKK
jgi:hypothetical protein